MEEVLMIYRAVNSHGLEIEDATNVMAFRVFPTIFVDWKCCCFT